MARILIILEGSVFSNWRVLSFGGNIEGKNTKCGLILFLLFNILNIGFMNFSGLEFIFLNSNYFTIRFWKEELFNFPKAR